VFQLIQPKTIKMEIPVEPKMNTGTPPEVTAPIRKNFEQGSQPTERIRPELNIEKWPAIWSPAYSHNLPVARTLEREHTIADGTRVRARVEVGFSHLGELTTEDQKTYYALVKQWEVSGRSPQQTFFSIRGLARYLHKRWGTNVITAVTASLRRLRATPITWEDAYVDGARRQTLEEVNTFTILSELKIVRKKIDGHVTKEAGYYRFNDFSLNNLLNRHTKPVLFETILGFRGNLAQLLYSHLDLIMADKRRYERRTRELCEDLGLRGSEYQRLYERRRVFTKAIAELRGVNLTTGAIADISIEKTQDGKDYKLTVSKSSHRSKLVETPELASGGGLPAPDITAPDQAFSGQARELVRHFHRTFHKVIVAYPQAKEITHATALVAQHGFERAKYVIDYAHLAAAKTNYSPQTLGGILQYTSRAVGAYDEVLKKNEAIAHEREQAKTRAGFQALQLELAEQRWKDAEQRLANLTPAEHDALRARVKADLLRSSWPRETSTAFQRVLHRQMVSELMRQMGESHSDV
jgi:hypothetical protein